MDINDIKISGIESNQILSLYDRVKDYISYLDNEINAYKEAITEQRDKE